MYNLQVRGKRGNIVQVYFFFRLRSRLIVFSQVFPGVEYDFAPTRLDLQPGDYLHIQWTGSNTNPDNNAGQGQEGSDRSNIIVTQSVFLAPWFLSPFSFSPLQWSQLQWARNADQLCLRVIWQPLFPSVFFNISFLRSAWGNDYPGFVNVSFMSFSTEDLVFLATGLKTGVQIGGSMSQLDDAGTVSLCVLDDTAWFQIQLFFFSCSTLILDLVEFLARWAPITTCQREITHFQIVIRKPCSLWEAMFPRSVFSIFLSFFLFVTGSALTPGRRVQRGWRHAGCRQEHRRLPHNACRCSLVTCLCHNLSASRWHDDTNGSWPGLCFTFQRELSSLRQTLQTRVLLNFVPTRMHRFSWPFPISPPPFTLNTPITPLHPRKTLSASQTYVLLFVMSLWPWSCSGQVSFEGSYARVSATCNGVYVIRSGMLLMSSCYLVRTVPIVLTEFNYSLFTGMLILTLVAIVLGAFVLGASRKQNIVENVHPSDRWFSVSWYQLQVKTEISSSESESLVKSNTNASES